MINIMKNGSILFGTNNHHRHHLQRSRILPLSQPSVSFLGSLVLFGSLLLLLLLCPSQSFHAVANQNNKRSSTNISENTFFASSSESFADTNNTTSSMAAAAMSNANQKPLSVGFLGCGTIASSIARGMILAFDQGKIEIESMVVSKRSESKSNALWKEYQTRNKGKTNYSFSIAQDNQEILDRCDLVFLTVLPQQASSVLQSLTFDPKRHILVSLVSTANLEDLVKDSKLNLSSVSKMICLPSIANHQGVALLCCGRTSGSDTTPEKTLLTNLFQSMGGVVSLDTEADLEACMVTTCTMGPLYGTMLKQRDWLLQKTKTLSKEDATFLVIQQFQGAVSDASSLIHENRLEDLIQEQTPGGLNEQALRNYGEILGGFEELQHPVMDAILSRIRGESDGNLSSPSKSSSSTTAT